jgi:hypothetical protein
MDMMDEGMIDARVVADMALMWLSEHSVAEMMRANDLLQDEVEDDGDVDENQEWADYDGDC